MLRKSHFLISIFILSFIFGSIEGIAQNNLFLVTLNSNPDREELIPGDVSALQEGHLENIGRLYKEGDLLLAGPFDGGGGIFLLKAASLNDAKELLTTDPAISADRFIVETHEMEIEKGWICAQNKPYEIKSWWATDQTFCLDKSKKIN